LGAAPERSDPIVLRPTDRVARRVRVGLALALVVLVGHLLFGANPWQDGIAARLADGEALRPADYWETYGWWMALLSAAFLGAALLGWRHWLPGSASLQPGLRPAAAPRALWASTAVALLLAAGLGAPRLSQGLWQDEEHSIRAAISGAYLADESGELRFWGTDFGDVFLYDFGPNNHVGFTFLAKLGVEGWALLAQPRDRRPPEALLRMPAFLLGLGSIASIAWLGWRIGLPAAGGFAALALALHPWHTRFLSEARGYSLLLCGVSASLALLHRALELGTWRRWLLFALAQFAVLWTFPAAVYAVLAIHLVAVAGLWQLHGAPRATSDPWRRFAMTVGASALLWLLLMSGNIAAMAGYLEDKPARSLGASFLRELGASLYAGTPWSQGRDAGDLYPELGRVAGDMPLRFWGLAALTAVAAAIGAVRVARLRPLGACLLAALVVPVCVAYAVHAAREDFIYTRNFVYVLPGLALLVGAGLSAAPPGGPKLATKAVPVLMAAWLAAFAWLTHPMRDLLRSVPVQPYRESAALTRPGLDLWDPGQGAVLTTSFSGEGFYYDPWVHMIREPAELRALMQRAEREGLPLFVNLGRLRLAARRRPELLAMVEDPTLYDEVARLPGLTPDFSRRVYRYRGSNAP